MTPVIFGESSPAATLWTSVWRTVLAALAYIVLVTHTAVADPSQTGGDVVLRTISSRADSASGGDVLIELRSPNSSTWIAHFNGRDVSSSFRPTKASHAYVALLDGLKNGKNILEILVDGTVRSTLEIVGHPLAGPIFSGPHQQPFICETDVDGLGPAIDRDCNAKTIVQYYYKSTEPVSQKPDIQLILATINRTTSKSLPQGFKPYDTSAPPPADMAKTVTSEGNTVNYVIRRELGVINRAVYEIQFLHQPGDPLPTPWARPKGGWNGRLVYEFGGGCSAGYRQGTLIPSGDNPQLVLAQGYALATSTLNIAENNCNDRVSAETLSMVREHFIKSYGMPVHTIGFGASGGAIQVHMIAQNYPGLLDGIIPKMSFPDMLTTDLRRTDCILLDRAFRNSGDAWSEQQKTAVSGFATWHDCLEIARRAPSETAKGRYTEKCDASIPPELVYDHITNPTGARCDYFSTEKNVFGFDRETGLVRRPLDNIGVQYGLRAFNDAKISAEQFIDLNENVGGIDGDGLIVSARTRANTDALKIAYTQGLVVTGGGGLSQIPIIDWRYYVDDRANLHDAFRSYAMRARLSAANGDADNQVILVDPAFDYFHISGRLDPNDGQYSRREGELIRQMDRWLDNVSADASSRTEHEKVVANKPSDLVDGCWTLEGERISEPASYGGHRKCNDIYPSHADPRIAAGGPVSDDVLKCQLKPIDSAEYLQPLTADQLARLKVVFPSGVCDWGRPGVGQEITKSTWRFY
ncbi:hypothetical protein FBZ93_12239 [Bradyrhizobium macuxiense]|uniref:DUF6351 domain-containing protein n=1 Tax=Bradyrhizobium macuxiense TaxID=1755647 RepID=A0A560KVH8_9BRAD|nr:DUF6351 family protein [Bradyrhizobium macuxiense]TWB87258.1 hypothetical protein FBZ93_12239 [Bradyrhizobium macuxiense]